VQLVTDEHNPISIVLNGEAIVAYAILKQAPTLQTPPTMLPTRCVGWIAAGKPVIDIDVEFDVPAMLVLVVLNTVTVLPVFVHPQVLVMVVVKPVQVHVNVPVVVEPEGVAHVPSPRQNVEDDALVPLFRLATGRLPDTSAAKATLAHVAAPEAFSERGN
jgi:hypothetical protein